VHKVHCKKQDEQNFAQLCGLKLKTADIDPARSTKRSFAKEPDENQL